jgi:hypothetical protein
VGLRVDQFEKNDESSFRPRKSAECNRGQVQLVPITFNQSSLDRMRYQIIRQLAYRLG